MEIKFANNASTVLANAIEEETTTLIVATDAGQLFPVLSLPTDYFKITVVNPGDGTWEIMRVTQVTGDEFTVERAQEGTIAKSFPQNSIVENRLTAESIEAILNDVSSTTTTAGRVRIATEAEVEDGSVTDACLTPANSSYLKVFPGVITMFSGVFDNSGFPIDSTTNKVRTDWHRCDGTYNTPNLQDKFIVCAGSKYPVATSGGSTSYEFSVEVLEHKLTIEEMPSHKHALAIGNDDGAWPNPNGCTDINGWTNSPCEETGGDKPHKHDAKIEYPDNIVPPYYALAYIMKIK